MRVAVSSDGTKDEGFDGHFGRCEAFVVVDTDTGERAAIANPGALPGSGAGVRAAKAVAAAGVDAVITGWIGPHGYGVLEKSGVAVYATPPESVADAVAVWTGGGCSQLSPERATKRAGRGSVDQEPSLGPGGTQGQRHGRVRGRGPQGGEHCAGHGQGRNHGRR